MTTRMRSPNYPGTPLQQAIDIVGKIFKVERTNPVDREVAAKAAGYTGISGRSAKVLADLSQYGLLERTGKSGVRVTKRAVEILHPDNIESRQTALREAAFEPELFQRISARFPDGMPSENALRSFFLKEGFADSAIQPAMRGYFETCQFIEETIVSGSDGHGSAPESESVQNQQIDVGRPMSVLPVSNFNSPQATSPQTQGEKVMNLDWQNKQAVLSLVIRDRAEARNVIDFINAIVQLLPQGHENAVSGNDDQKADSE